MTLPGERSTPWVIHFARFVLLLLVGYFTLFGALVGLAYVFTRTGYRVRDIPMILIPVWGAITLVEVLWRYAARAVYWEGGWSEPRTWHDDWIRMRARRAQT